MFRDHHGPMVGFVGFVEDLDPTLLKFTLAVVGQALARQSDAGPAAALRQE